MQGKAVVGPVVTKRGQVVASSDELAGAIVHLQAFMAEMNAWETKYVELVRRDGIETIVEPARAELAAIYGTFLTERERKTGRLASVDVGYPAAFDPQRERVEASELLANGKAVIVTNVAHPNLAISYQEKRRYTLVPKGEAWLLDKQEHERSNGKWVNVVF